MTFREWTDPRDGRHWEVWLEPADRPVLSFRSDGEFHTLLLDSGDGLDDWSDEELQRWLDEARG